MVKYIVVMVMYCLLLSCEKEVDDANTSMQHILGSWDVTDIIEEYRADTLFATTDNEFEAHFLQDATGYTKKVLPA